MRVLFYLIATVTVSLGTMAQGSIKMSLEECIKYALDNNQDVQIARLDNEIAVTQIRETLSDGLPQVNGNIGITNNIDIQVNPIPDFISPPVYDILRGEGLLPQDAATPDPGIVPAAFGTPWTGNAGVSVSQLIFDGSFFVGVQASRTVKLLSEKETRQTEVDIIENVSKAYYLTLISQRNLEFLARNFATVDTLLIETEAQYETGFAEQIDVSRIKIQHNNLRTDLKNSTEFLITSYNLLKFQMGMPVESPLVITDELQESDFTTLSTDTAGVIYQRPEYDVLLTNRALVDLNIKNFNAQYLPNLYANFNLGWTSGTRDFDDLTNSNNWFRYTNLGLNLSIPIFDGLRKSANIQRNRIQRKQIQQGISQLGNNIKREVTEANIKYENAVRDVFTQRENMELSGEVYNATKIKYQEGIGSNIEVVQTITSYEEARNNYLTALFDAATAQIELKKALGTLDQ